MVKIETLAGNVYKNHLQVQSQLAAIGQLKKEIQESRLECLQSQWLARNRRYLTEKLNQNCKEHIDLIDTLNNDETFRFLKASTCSKFGSVGESAITELFQYLRDNPKLIAYLLFFNETAKSSFLELFAKISVSSIYSHCLCEQDRNGVVQILNELLDIYINFYNVNFRSQIYHKNSAFIIMFQSFCSVLPEVKTFFNLTLRQAVMQVLTEDTYYLDIDSNKACMRFKQEERLKHFGPEASAQFGERMQIYKEWTINRLKTFVDMFISHLKCNIFAFPKSLATIFVRLFSKMIITMEFNEVRTIFLDLLFSFLICPVIQNPDWFGLVDLHIDNVAKYNLQQCALIIQHLALSQTNTEHELVCQLFDKDSLGFVIDHILRIFNNNEQAQQSPKLDTRFEQIPENVSAFLISEFELKLVLEYLRLFINENPDCSEDMKRLYFKVPKQCFMYEIQRQESKTSLKSAANSLKLPSALRKQRSQETIVDTSEEFSFDGAFREKNAANLLEHYKPLISSRTVLQFHIYQNQDSNVLTSKEFFQEFKAAASQFSSLEALFDYLKQKFCLEFRKEPKLLSVSAFESPEKLLLPDLDTHLIVDLNGPFGTKNLVSEKRSEPFGTVDNGKLIDFSPVEDSNFLLVDVGPESIPKSNSLPKTASASNSRPSSSSSSSGRMNAKNFFNNLNLRNIKDKVKNIAESSKNNSTSSRSSDLLESVVFNSDTGTLISTEHELKFNPEDVKDKTDEILSKYRSSISKIDVPEKLLDFDELFPEAGSGNVEKMLQKDCKGKLYKLFCLVNISTVLEGFEFLNLEELNHFIMFQKVLLSEAQNSESLTEIVLITDIINSLKALSITDFNCSLEAINEDLKIFTFYSVYLFKFQEFLLEFRTRIDKMLERCQGIQQETDYKVVIFLTGKVFDDYEDTLANASVKFEDLSVPLDEKIEIVKSLMKKMLQSSELSVLTDQQFTMAKAHIERHLVSCFYLQLFFANGDIDRLRDQIMHQQIDKLSQTINPSSKLLKIPIQFQGSSPWPSAQRELQLMSVYKTAHEKIECIQRCCKHIITLLNAADSAVAAADELLPVLIFVVIKANPMFLLSTIQYVNAFLAEELSGEAAYYWTQFCSVVEFIKTIIHQTD